MLLRDIHAVGSAGAIGFPDLGDEVLPLLEPVTFQPGQLLQEDGREPLYGFLIGAGLVTMSVPDRLGHFAEVGMLGPGSFVGSPTAHPGAPATQAVHARSTVQAGRIEMQMLRRLLERSARLRELFGFYGHALLEQALERVACTARHSLDQRLARWIHLASRQLDGLPLPVTHETLGELLNVRRATVTTALHRLEGERAIHAARGAIRVWNHAVLERCSCGCHAMARLLLPPGPVGAGRSRPDEARSAATSRQSCRSGEHDVEAGRLRTRSPFRVGANSLKANTLQTKAGRFPFLEISRTMS